MFGCEFTGCGRVPEAGKRDEAWKLYLFETSNLTMKSGDEAPDSELGRVVEEEVCRDQQ